MGVKCRISRQTFEIDITPTGKVCYINGGKTPAAIECLVSYACNRVADGNRSKATAMIECLKSYVRHGVGDCDGGKAAASCEFVYGCVSD